MEGSLGPAGDSGGLITPQSGPSLKGARALLLPCLSPLARANHGDET